MKASDILAEELSGQHIGDIISFDWKFRHSDVRARLTGELREVHHYNHSELVVWLAGPESAGDKGEFTVSRGTIISLEQDDVK